MVSIEKNVSFTLVTSHVPSIFLHSSVKTELSILQSISQFNHQADYILNIHHSYNITF